MAIKQQIISWRLLVYFIEIKVIVAALFYCYNEELIKGSCFCFEISLTDFIVILHTWTWLQLWLLNIQFKKLAISNIFASLLSQLLSNWLPWNPILSWRHYNWKNDNWEGNTIMPKNRTTIFSRMTMLSLHDRCASSLCNYSI